MTSNRLKVRRAAALAVVASALGPAPALAVPASGSIFAQPRVLGGEIAPPGAYPHQAQLRVSLGNGSTAICGASLIARRYLLTAAHCVTRADDSVAPPSAITVLLGKQDRTQFTDADRYAVDLVQRHEAFDPSYANDVAVVRLARPADVGQARLARPRDAATWAPGREATVIGWGRTTNLPGDPGSSQLLQVDLPIVGDDACTRLYGTDYRAALELCAGGEEGRDSCSGDSGGPLLSTGAAPMVVGLVSFGPDVCGSAGQPASYTRVGADPLNAWVRDRVPQAEFDVSPAVPQPGQPVTLTSAARNPVGSYTSLAWDLDGDGQFDDATGPIAQTALPEGRHVLGLQASDAAGDREQRHVVVDVPRSPVAFSVATAIVREGRAVVLTVGKAGGATGVLQPVATGRTATAGRDFRTAIAPVTFAPTDTARTVTVHTVQDRLDEPPETLVVSLGSPSPGLVVGAPDAVRVTIIDDDRAPRPVLGHVRAGRTSLTAPVSVIQRGRLSLRLTDRHTGQLLGTVTRTARHAGRATLRARYTPGGRRLLRRGHRSVRVSVAFTTPVGGRAGRSSRNLTAPDS